MNRRSVEEQIRLRRMVSEYFNQTVFWKPDILLQVGARPVLFCRSARAIVHAYKALPQTCKMEAKKKQITLIPYDGGIPLVRRMMAFLELNAGRDLYGAYLHGSLATGEQVRYSDFDALVIINDCAMRDAARLARLARVLNRARQIMLEYDPLQHHGWFVLTETDLAFYCEAWFPHELFNYSKSLLLNQGLHFELTPRDSSAEIREAFQGIASSLRQSIDSGQATKNLYQLRSTLSLFMLLPACYVQVRDGRGIYKKFSFDAARADFTDEEWTCMDRVSEIRTTWDYRISPFRRKLLSRPWPIRRQLLRFLSPPIPVPIRRQIMGNLFPDMNRLAQRMAVKLGLQ